jgi:hypothetical protein
MGVGGLRGPSMAIIEQVPSTEVAPAYQPAQDVASLISKLRWIGMDDEARHLQAAVAMLPADARGTTSAEPLNTD